MVAVFAPPFSADDFRRRAFSATDEADGDYGDHRFNPELRELIVRPGLRQAAVLVPIVDRRPQATMLLTRRTEKMRSHPGQIAFPGGAIDPGDASAEAAALRETAEEIGLGSEDIDIVGRIPDYFAGSGYRIAPVLGIVRADYLATLNEDEVDDLFEVPLAFLMNPDNHQRGSRIWQERRRFYYTMPFDDRHIWGVTAGIIRTIYERLYA